MRSVDEHLAEILARVGPLRPMDLHLLDAHGCVLAEDVVAPAPLPGFDNSSMDGYAVRSADVAGATPQAAVSLPVIGDIAAGTTKVLTIQPGLCARIMTGAPIPPGADAVVPVEWTDGDARQVRIGNQPAVGAYIRRAGEDVRAGDTVAHTGTLLGSTQIALLAAVGRRTVVVRPKPRVVVISTGAELVDLGESLGYGQIVDSNSYALTAAVREAGAIAYQVGIVPDNATALTRAIEDHLIQADLIVSSGGVSVGAYDVVKQVLSKLGTVGFHQVAMQPGMPQGFGVVGDDIPYFGLPGNPVSALVSFEVFVRPALRRMLGAEPLGRPQVTATLTQAVHKPIGKRQFLRVYVTRQGEQVLAEPTGGQGSHMLAGLAAANGLAIIPEDVAELPAGTPVTIWLLERRGR
ncbi:MAG: molybdopterin molybdotransferase [Frankiaceae bacterium]|jgi:molybdopterin molybdotransferase|nr:molybdopterin molybdotransferase [Frankiaceae bacterium]